MLATCGPQAVIMHTVCILTYKFPAPEYSSRHSVQGTAVRMSSALPKARALGRSMEGSPVGAAVPCKPNTCWARIPTRGAARAASAPSKHLQEGSPVTSQSTVLAVEPGMVGPPNPWHW